MHEVFMQAEFNNMHCIKHSCVCPLQLSDDRDPDADVRASRGAARSLRGSALLPAGCGVSAVLLLCMIMCYTVRLVMLRSPA